MFQHVFWFSWLVFSSSGLEIYLELLNTTSSKQEFIIIRDEYGNVDIISTLPQISAKDFNPEEDIVYYLFTRSHKDVPQILKFKSYFAVHSTDFSPDRPTRLLIHGWLGHVNSKSNELIRTAYLERGEFNVIVVDWSAGASDRYVFARFYITRVGRAIAKFVDYLHEHCKLDLDLVYLVGFSLGAHVAGVVGRSISHGRIHTIFGLDPAFPGFYNEFGDDVLRLNDAGYVESIHTNAGVFGFRTPIGHAAFYPNFGVFQPGCERARPIQCSHERAFMYFAESIRNEQTFSGFKCRNHYEIVLLQFCSRIGHNIKMAGEPSTPGRYGVYYVPTNSQSPFALPVRNVSFTYRDYL